jgi:hypothetical protein
MSMLNKREAEDEIIDQILCHLPAAGVPTRVPMTPKSVKLSQWQKNP